MFAWKALLAITGDYLFTGKLTQREILQALQSNEPFKGSLNIRVENLVVQLEGSQKESDAKFDLRFVDMNVKVYAEIKTNCSDTHVHANRGARELVEIIRLPHGHQTLRRLVSYEGKDTPMLIRASAVRRRGHPVRQVAGEETKHGGRLHPPCSSC